MPRAVALGALLLALLVPAAPAVAGAQATAIGSGGAVASVDRTATHAGIEVLRHGGNAIDAAVAANTVLGVTEPYVAGIGGGGFMTIYLADQHKVVTVLPNPDLAHAYDVIAHDGPGAFYDGPIGAAVVDTVRNPPLAPDANLGFEVRPGVMTTDDLGAYTAPQRDPTHVNYRGLDV